MALTERSRHKLFEVFHDLVDDEQAVQEMLSYFPARDVEEPVTKDFLRAEIGGLRAEMQSEFGAVRAEMHSEIGGLRAETQAEFGGVRGEIHELRTEMHTLVRSLQTWTVTVGVSLAGLMLAIARFG